MQLVPYNSEKYLVRKSRFLSEQSEVADAFLTPSRPPHIEVLKTEKKDVVGVGWGCES